MEGVAVDLNYPQISMGRFHPVTLRVDFVDSGNLPPPIFAAIGNLPRTCASCFRNRCINIRIDYHRLVGMGSIKRICDAWAFQWSVQNQKKGALGIRGRLQAVPPWYILVTVRCGKFGSGFKSEKLLNFTRETCAIFKETFVNLCWL